jgi:hypothetical protein
MEGQAALPPAAIEDYVAADAPVRAIDAFVDGLDVNGLQVTPGGAPVAHDDDRTRGCLFGGDLHVTAP